MKKIKNTKKTNFFKKIFIRLCRLLGFEIIDQSNFKSPRSCSCKTNNITFNFSIVLVSDLEKVCCVNEFNSSYQEMMLERSLSCNSKLNDEPNNLGVLLRLNFIF